MITRKELLTINGREYTEAELSEAFDKVADPNDWKAPIDTTVTFADMREGAAIKAAVVFYTGTEATLKLLASHGEGYTVHVGAVGYRMGPCGDG